MSKQRILFLTAIILLMSCAPISSQEVDSTPVNHEQFTLLLKKHVSSNGMVDYEGFIEDKEVFDRYLSLLRNNPPNEETWTKNEQMAYWINAYNAFTIDLIMQHYPVSSIKDIGSTIQIPFVNTPWDIKFIKIGDVEYDLNNIEHGILRKKWSDPRIHFAVNCASFSCPRLRREAYEADILSQQLDEQAIAFINNEELNSVKDGRAELSKIFSWYAGDFKRILPVKEYINQYSEVLMSSKTEIDYKEYDWTLNKQN